MNKIIILALTALLATALTYTNLPRHLNPQQAEPEMPSKLELLMIYGSIIDAAISQNFTYALEKIHELYGVYIPENVKYVYDRFNELLSKEVSKLDQTSIFLNETKLKLSQGLLENATRTLKNAETSLAEADIIHRELEDSSKEFSSVLGISLPQLSRKLEELRDLIQEYRDEIYSLSLQIKQLKKKEIIGTKLTLWASSSEAWIGSRIMIYGTLRDEDDNPMMGRTVTICLDGRRIKEFVTHEDGSFYGSIDIPYLYEPNVKLSAEYIPRGDDLGKFKASRSKIIMLSLIYDTPTINVYVDKMNATPLETLKVTGQILTSSGILPDSLHVDAFGETRVVRISGDGFFNLTINIPGRASTGIHEIIFYTEAHDILAPARNVTKINVYRIPVHLSIKAPTIALTGTQMLIEGKLSTAGNFTSNALDGELVLEFLGDRHILKVENGTFSANLSIPLMTSSGFTDLVIKFDPVNPVYSHSITRLKLLTINPIIILIPLFGVIYLSKTAVKAISLKRRPRPEITAKKAEAVKEIERRIGGLAEIAKIYLEAVKVVEKMIGVARKPSETIREFLNRVIDILGEKAAIFEEISYIAETAIYGGVKPDMKLVRNLLDKMRRWIHEA